MRDQDKRPDAKRPENGDRKQEGAVGETIRETVEATVGVEKPGASRHRDERKDKPIPVTATEHDSEPPRGP
jgi:hypothetical protein